MSAMKREHEDRVERPGQAMYRQFSLYRNDWDDLTPETRQKWLDTAERILAETDDGIVRQDSST